MSPLQPSPFRPGASAPRSLALRVIGRSRILDSIVVPLVPLIGLCVAAAVASHGHALAFGAGGLALLALAVVLVVWMARPCRLVLEPPYRVLRWTHRTLAEPRSIELDELVEVGTDVVEAGDSVVTLVAFVLKDGRRVRLVDDVNLAFGDGDARRLRARIVAFLDEARRASDGGPPR